MVGVVVEVGVVEARVVEAAVVEAAVVEAACPQKKCLWWYKISKKVLKERFVGKEQKISENFYVRGDGTRAFYFSDEFLRNLFEENGFVMEEHVVCCKQVENRSKEIVMNRRWIQAVFRVANTNTISDDGNGFEIEMSEGMAVEMFGTSSSSEEHLL